MADLILIAMMLAAQAAPLSAEAESEEAIALARDEVATYSFYLDEPRKIQLELRREPVLRWTSHLRRRFYGDVFIWTHDGRPEAVASITNSYGRYHVMETEAHSLSLSKFIATRADRLFWHPARAGLDFALVPDAPEVAEVPVRRLLQMRTIARQFSATSTAGSQQTQLRLLSQPVYRYASGDSNILDGAMFVFANGTDPDVFLLIEARQSESKTSWQFAIARFNSHVDLQVRYNGLQVWTVPRLRGGELKNPESPYFAFQRRILETSGSESE